jgi:hypothetical protein
MFGETSGFLSTDSEETSEKYNALVDKQVKDILDVSDIYITLTIKFRNHLKELLNCYNIERRN